MVLQNYMRAKQLLPRKKISIDYIAAEYKESIPMASDFKFQLPCEKSPPVKLGVVSKNTHNYPKKIGNYLKRIVEQL